jgi:molybdopterin synthase catalytic subunit
VTVSPHRREALEAVSWAIDELKRKVPIWKKEYYEDGEVSNGEESGCKCSHQAEWKGNPEF